MKKLERENSELKFLNGQYAQRMKALEAESSQKSERILQLQDKNQQATVHVRGGTGWFVMFSTFPLYFHYFTKIQPRFRARNACGINEKYRQEQWSE